MSLNDVDRGRINQGFTAQHGFNPFLARVDQLRETGFLQGFGFFASLESSSLDSWLTWDLSR
ncbi:Uncharacterised protein [Vibrio cholerae]|nr:Uncharacterised protein [Vibrio cholerae]